MITSFQESNMIGPKNTRPTQEVSRLLTAAVISTQFRRLLLTSPDKAISAGFGGESFQLHGEEKHRLASIHANNLAEFASQVQSQASTRKAALYTAGD